MTRSSYLYFAMVALALALTITTSAALAASSGSLGADRPVGRGNDVIDGGHGRERIR